MKLIVTGAPGFVGRHMAAEVLRAGHEVILTGVVEGAVDVWGYGSRHVVKMDISDEIECNKVVALHDPDAVIHLAGIAQTTGQSIELLNLVNVKGAENVVRSLANLPAKVGLDPRIFLFVSSAFVYGEGLHDGTYFFKESSELKPRGLYGASKLAGEIAVNKYQSSRMLVYVARPFNHIGPGQEETFVVPALAARIRKASDGGTIETGNLNSSRDFTDVRDVVRAYRLIIEKRPQDCTFVIGSARSVTVQSVFDFLVRCSGKSLRQTVSEHLKRSEGTAAFIADIASIKNALGWLPEISIEQSIRDVWDESQQG